MKSSRKTVQGSPRPFLHLFVVFWYVYHSPFACACIIALDGQIRSIIGFFLAYEQWTSVKRRSRRRAQRQASDASHPDQGFPTQKLHRLSLRKLLSNAKCMCYHIGSNSKIEMVSCATATNDPPDERKSDSSPTTTTDYSKTRDMMRPKCF